MRYNVFQEEYILYRLGKASGTPIDIELPREIVAEWRTAHRAVQRVDRKLEKILDRRMREYDYAVMKERKKRDEEEGSAG